MCNCSSFRENCVTHSHTHARTHTHGANYNLPPGSWAGDKNIHSTATFQKYCDIPMTLVQYVVSVNYLKIFYCGLFAKMVQSGNDFLTFLLPPNTFQSTKVFYKSLLSVYSIPKTPDLADFTVILMQQCNF